MNEEEIVKRCVKNIRNANYVNFNCEPEFWMKQLLRENKVNLHKIINYIENPPPDVPQTKYKLFENAKVIASLSPGDLHDLSWQFHDGWTEENWVESRNQMALHHINASRHFFSCSEGAGDLDRYLVPFKRVANKKFNLWELDPIDWPRIKWRLDREIERGIVPIICIASGWKGRRVKYTAWHPNHGFAKSDLYMHDNYKYWMTDKDSIKIYDGVCDMLYDAMEGKPFIMEWVNEPQAFSTNVLYPWYDGRFARWGDHDRFAFEKWDSGRIEDLLTDYPGCWCFVHGINTLREIERWHKGEMQWYHETFDNVCYDSDGQGFWLGEGLVGKGWNPNFRRITPRQLETGMVYDYHKQGAGYVHLSAISFYQSSQPDFASFMEAGVEGLSKARCQELGVNWDEFSRNGKPLPELLAFKNAMEIIHGGQNE